VLLVKGQAVGQLCVEVVCLWTDWVLFACEIGEED
jgi:hypothetical protein